MKKSIATTLLLSLIICVGQASAFTLTRAILATDDNPDYIQFWPVVAKAWRENMGIEPTLALVAYEEVTVDESLGDVIRFMPIPGIPTSLQAQVIRLFFPALFPDDFCVISDIDMIPLSKPYFQGSVYGIPDDKFVVYRDGANPEHFKAYPMCYNAAKGSTFAEMFRVSDMSSIRERIQEWYDLQLGWSTDELMMHKTVHEWPEAAKRVVRLGHGVGPRIFMPAWSYSLKLLKNGYYIDAHCPRPYDAHKHLIDPVAENAQKPRRRRRA